MIERKEIENRFRKIQQDICEQLEFLDGKSTFKSENWTRPEGGGGLTRVIEKGNIIEKGGVNFSAVEGALPDNIKNALKIDQKDFFATGVSIVIHPSNPYHPIIHMNIRYFELGNGDYWFGGGIDLTPIYIDKEEAKFFHHQMKTVCDLLSQDSYSKYKKWADDYFYINHRNETRGIGGIFFDRINKVNTGEDKSKILDFVCSVGESFAPTYLKIIESKGKDHPFTENNKNWQYVRRGRYVEFNLVYDKGTKFGLDTNGRIESILMSLPPQADWIYDLVPEKDSEESKTQQSLKKGINWI